MDFCRLRRSFAIVLLLGCSLMGSACVSQNRTPSVPVEEKCSLTVKVEGKGTVSPTVGSHSYTKSQVVALTATAGDGHVFFGWEGIDEESPKASITMSSDRTVKAVFVPEEVPAKPEVPVVAEPVKPVEQPPAQARLEATASVSNAKPKQNSTISVTVRVTQDGKPVQGAKVEISCHYKSTKTPYSGVTTSNGTATIPFSIGRATLDYEVRVAVTVTHKDQTTQASTSFTPTK